MNRDISELAKQYRSLFENPPFPKAVALRDPPYPLPPFHALGLVNNFQYFTPHVAGLSSAQMADQASRARQEGYLSTAFFYHVIGRMLEGRAAEEIISPAALEKEFPIGGGYTAVYLPASSPGDRHNSITFFLDWHDTMTDRGNMRKNVEGFLEHYQALNRKMRARHYQSIITTASGTDFDRHYLDALELLQHAQLIDSVFTVPIAIPKPGESLAGITGKLYKGLLRSLYINYERSVIITDIAMDHPIDISRAPALTLVTPHDMEADLWVNAVDFFEKMGDSNFLLARERIKREPFDLISFPVPEDAESRIIAHVYQFDKGFDNIGLNLFTLPYLLPDCYFMYQGDHDIVEKIALRTLQTMQFLQKRE